MKKLENYGVVSLDAREMTETDGGLTHLGVWAITQISIFCAGFQEGWNESKR